MQALATAGRVRGSTARSSMDDGGGEAKGACPEEVAPCFFCLAFLGTLAGFACLISAWAMASPFSARAHV